MSPLPTPSSSPSPSRWEGAAAIARELPAPAERCLRLLARLPLAPGRVLQRLSGLDSPDGLHAGLDLLRERELAARIDVSLAPGPRLRLWHLTDLGVAAVAGLEGCEPDLIVACGRLGRTSLRRDFERLPALLALYDALALLAGSVPGSPRLVAWRRPWDGRYERPRTGRVRSLALPAFTALVWEGGGAGEAPRRPAQVARVLLPDLPDRPPRVWRSGLRCFIDDRLGPRPHETVARGDGRAPLLIVTPHGARAAAWSALLTDLCGARGYRDWAATGLFDLVSHEGVRLAPTGWTGERFVPALEPAGVGTGPEHGGLAPAAIPPPARIWPPRCEARAPDTPLSRPVGAPLSGPAAAGARLAVELTPADWALLRLIGAHPFLRLAWLAELLGWSTAHTRARRNRLIARGLVRLLGPEETRPVSPGYRARLVAWEPAELTGAGLGALARRQGLSPATAIACHGLAGGGPERPRGARAALARNVAHTDGVHNVFMALRQAARRENERLGIDPADPAADALLEWRNGSAASRGALFHPDGYGVYRRRERTWPFYLECDRATERAARLLGKFVSYARWREEVWCAREHPVFPTILVVTVSDAAEGLIAAAALRAAAGYGAPLPLLITTAARVNAAADGLLGAVWREATGDGRDRRFWVRPVKLGQGHRPAGTIGRAPWQPRVPAGGWGGDGREEFDGDANAGDVERLMRRAPDRPLGH